MIFCFPQRFAGLLTAMLSLVLAPTLLQAGLLTGNLLAPQASQIYVPGGVPYFWNQGGSSTAIDVVSTTKYVSQKYSLELNDTNSTGYGEWYSNKVNITGGTNYQFRYNLYYNVSNLGIMRVSVNFYDASGNSLPGLAYTFTGAHLYWEEITQQISTPATATTLNFSFSSGGDPDVTGQAYLDDISLAPSPTVTSLVPYLENFPMLPTPLVIRDWKQTASGYHQLAFNPSISGQSLPLLYQYTANTLAGFSGPAFGLPSYVGYQPGSAEALSALGAVLGGTLTGLDMSTLNGQDRVQQCEVFYCSVNSHGLVLNNQDSQGAGSSWYDIFPSILFYEICSRYPGNSSFQTEMRAIADSWLTALPVLSNNWEHTGFNFTTMTPTDLGWHEPDMAIGIAWLEYMAYVQFGDAKYLAAADTCMTQMNSRTLNPFYEVLGFFGPALAARMDAELGRTYSTGKHLNWVFAPTSDARPGWGCENSQWGSYDARGLMGSTTDTTGYAFSMNTFTAAGSITPAVRYQPKYARLLGRWLLHVAANANLFYPSTLPTTMQSSAPWVQQTNVQSISYEGVRHLSVSTPYATGDASAPLQDLTPYGAWGSGWMAALFQTTNVGNILKIDCLATEAFPSYSYPTYLYYNPNTTTQQVTVNVGSIPQHLFDSVSGSFIATNVTGNVNFTIQPDSAIVLVLCPANGAISQTGEKLSVGGTVIDFWNGSLDTDNDGLPDWWESRYFGSTTSALPQTPAANGFTNLQCYQLGLDPTNPLANFSAKISLQPVTNYPQITWPTVGGKTYVVEYANSLALGTSGFTPAMTISETNVPAGVGSTETFLDDYTATGGPPGNISRFYRIRLVTP